MRATTRGNNPVTRWDPTGNFSCDLGQDCTEFYEDGLIDYYFQSTRDGGSSYTPGDSWTDLAGTHQSYSGYITTLYDYFAVVWIFDPPSVSFWFVEFAVDEPDSYTTTVPHTQESLNEYTEGYREGRTGPMPGERNVSAETMATSPGTGEKVKPARRPVAGGSSGAQVLTQAVAHAIGERYEVQAGDSLWAIAQRVYNDSSKWPAIFAANPQLQNPNVIFPGQVLNLPGAPARSDYSLVQQGEYGDATANRDFTIGSVSAGGRLITQDPTGHVACPADAELAGECTNASAHSSTSSSSTPSGSNGAIFAPTPDLQGMMTQEQFESYRKAYSNVYQGAGYDGPFLTTVGSVAFEPVDWFLTAADIGANGPSPAHLLGLLPFVPGTTSRLLRTAGGTPFADGTKALTSDILTKAETWLGPGYFEVEPGVFRSVADVDGSFRQFRMTDSDLAAIDNHAGAPHVNFEIWNPKPLRPGRMTRARNDHVYFQD